MLEASLIEKTIDELPLSLKLSENTISSREIPIGRRYIDIVFAEMPEACNYDNRVATEIASLSYKQLTVLAYFCNGIRKSKSRIIKDLYVKWDDLLANYLDVFVKKNLVKLIGEKTYYSDCISNIMPNRIIAVEAKVKNWKSVLSQAKYNIKYSSESYVLIPNSLMNKINVKAKNRRNKIGYLVANDFFKISNLPPKQNNFKNDLALNYMKLIVIKKLKEHPEKWIKI